MPKSDKIVVVLSVIEFSLIMVKSIPSTSSSDEPSNVDL